MTDKLHEEIDETPHFGDTEDYDTWQSAKKTRAEVKKEWDHLLEDNDPDLDLLSGRSASRNNNGRQI